MKKNDRFSKYGIIFRPMREIDLPLVREQRNKPDMRKWMTTQHIISECEMLQWFRRLPSTYRYYVVVWNEKKVGIANLKEINEFSADPGYMFWDEEFISISGCAFAALALFEHAFEVCGYARLEGTTEISNRKALRLARILGFRQIGTKEINGKSFHLMLQDKDGFMAIKERFAGLSL